MVLLHKFLLHFPLVNEMDAFDNFSFEGVVGLFLWNGNVLLELNPRWGRVELNLLPIMLKEAYVGSPLNCCIHIIKPRSSK